MSVRSVIKQKKNKQKQQDIHGETGRRQKIKQFSQASSKNARAKSVVMRKQERSEQN